MMKTIFLHQIKRFSNKTSCIGVAGKVKRISLLIVFLILFAADAGWQAYPVDGYILTGIRRLARVQMILDGEIYIHGWPLQKISGAARKKTYIPERHDQLQYWIYDIADTTKTFNDRADILTDMSIEFERNELINIPSSIGSLASLEILNLGDNKLETIPETIGNLKNLKSLNLSRNKLTVLPESISSLGLLEELYLGENNFKTYPSFLKKLEERGLQIYI